MGGIGLPVQPQQRAATLAGADSATPSFTVDAHGDYLLQLVVSDEAGITSEGDEVVISTNNLAPTANAGPDRLAKVGMPLTLDGGGSDPEGDALSYLWAIDSAPAGSTAAISDPTMATPEFTPDRVGSYELSLSVRDFLGPGAPDTVDITALTPSAYAEDRIMCAADLVAGLGPDEITNDGNRRALTNHLTQSVKQIQNGKNEKALKKLDDAIRRTDGCPASGAPHARGGDRDWVTSCSAQSSILACLWPAVEALSE